jgi:tetratricopeptide (TPR) repeat protein
MPTENLGLHRFRRGDDPRKQAEVWLEASRIMIRQGDLEEARRLLRAAVRIHPGCTEAWLQLAWLAEDPRERSPLLRRVLELEPGHAQAQAALAHLQPPLAHPVQRPSSGRRPLRRVALVSLALVAIASVAALLIWGPVDSSLAWLASTIAPTSAPTPTWTPAQIAARFAPELEASLTTGNWDRALEIVTIMRGIDPSGKTVLQWTLQTYTQYGQALVRSGQPEQALIQFDQALTLAPQDAGAQLWQQTTLLYLAGQEAFANGDWSTAIQAFSQAYNQSPGYSDLLLRLVAAYRHQGQTAIENGEWTLAIEALTAALDLVPGDPDLAKLLSAAYRQRGIARQEQRQLQEAKADLEAALALQPEDAQARTHLDQVLYTLFPPKRIEIDISKQWLYAWEGDTIVYDFVTSTGLPGQDTATGHYKVLDKIPMAYSSIWNLSMPYWLGIYYVGSVQNGIHALPIRPDGSVMWAGLLGQRASYGCVILTDEAAQLLYNWAEIGTPVDIHY